MSTEIRNTVSLVFYSILFIIGLLGNGLILLTVICMKKNPTFIIIGSLAAADLLFTVGRLSQEIVTVSDIDDITTVPVCKLKLFVLQLASYSAAYHLVLLAVVRYFYICHPFKAQELMTNMWALKIIIVLWAGLVILLSTLLFTTGSKTLSSPQGNIIFCHPNPDSVTGMTDFVICYSVFSYFIPLAMLIIFHSIKAGEVRKMMQNVDTPEKRQMSAMVVLVISCFGVLLFPIHCKNLIFVSGYDSNSQIMLNMDAAFRILAYSNSCINPFIYGIMSRSFQENLKKIFCAYKKNNRVVTVSEHVKTSETNT